jgi:hypothetical protein
VKALSRDTTLESLRVQIAIWKRLGPARKLDILSCAIRAGFRLHRPETASMEPMRIAHSVISFFETSNIEYFVGGSVASTIHGEPRFTQDVDLVVRLDAHQIVALQKALGQDFYSSEIALREAIERRSCANLIHTSTGFKIDLMISRERPFERSRFQRKQRIQDESHAFWVATPEDTVLVKLEWYRDGGEVSERQWRDVQTVLMTQEALDLDYMKHWATELDVSDLLEKALSEAKQ